MWSWWLKMENKRQCVQRGKRICGNVDTNLGLVGWSVLQRQTGCPHTMERHRAPCQREGQLRQSFTVNRRSLRGIRRGYVPFALVSTATTATCDAILDPLIPPTLQIFSSSLLSSADRIIPLPFLRLTLSTIHQQLLIPKIAMQKWIH